MTCDMWHVTHDMWHVICDTWHVTCDKLWGVYIFSKCQLPSSYGLWFMIFWRFWGKESLPEWQSESINYEGVLRTAPTTQGLLKNPSLFYYTTNLCSLHKSHSPQQTTQPLKVSIWVRIDPVENFVLLALGNTPGQESNTIRVIFQYYPLFYFWEWIIYHLVFDLLIMPSSTTLSEKRWHLTHDTWHMTPDT